MFIRLDLEGVTVRGRLVAVSDAEVDSLEAALGIPMPAGYREYLTRLGDGYLFTLLRVLPPAEILAQLDEHRERMSAYWFWDPGDSGFGQLEAMTSIPVADTLDGTVIVIWPDDPSHLYVLDRDGDLVVAIQPDILWLAEWLCTGGRGHSKARKRIFEPMRVVEPSGWDEAADQQPVEPDTDIEPGPQQDLSRSPTEVLLAYFAELEAAEVVAIEAHGGPRSFDGRETSDLEPGDPVVARAAAAFGATYRRYCSAGLARALGNSATLSSTPPHAAATIRVIEEESLAHNRLRIRAAHGPDPYTEVNDYTLERAGGEWRIIAQRQWVDPIPDPVDEPRAEPDPDRHAKIAAAIVDVERDPDDYWRLLGIFSDQAPDRAELEWVAQRLKQTATDPTTDPSRMERLRSLFRRERG
jgi:hypothetical protein